MTDRESTLRNLAVGNIFHARSPKWGEPGLPRHGVDDGTIYARRIHTQDNVRFDRATGLRLPSARTKIDCVTPFPRDIDNTFREMDRKYAEHTELFRNGVEPDPEKRKMTPDEKLANLSINSHVAANLI